MSWNEEIKKELGSCGSRVFIGEYVKILNPKQVHLGDRVRIDPFTLITSGLVTGSNIQICSHVVIGGGKSQTVTLGDCTFIGYGSKLFTASEDYSGDYGPVNEFWFKGNKIYRGDITFSNHSGIASNVIVMPGATLPEGTRIGAMSFVYKTRGLLPWSIYLGNPLKLHGQVNKDIVLKVAENQKFLKNYL